MTDSSLLSNMDNSAVSVNISLTEENGERAYVIGKIVEGFVCIIGELIHVFFAKNHN